MTFARASHVAGLEEEAGHSGAQWGRTLRLWGSGCFQRKGHKAGGAGGGDGFRQVPQAMM